VALALDRPSTLVRRCAPGEDMKARTVVAALALAVTGPARAQEWLERTYVEARTGVASPRADELAPFDPALSLEVGAGYRFHRNLAIEVSASRFAFETEPVQVGLTSSPSALIGTLILHERLLPVMLDAKGVLPLGRAELYALAGAGACFSSLGSSLWMDEPRTDNAWAWEAGAGASFRFAERFTATAGARWLRTQATYHGPTPVMLQGLRSPRLDSLVVAAGLAFRL
jgi:opacity protein-like surface antigen